MPSGYTQHYQLNVWDPEDAVLRSDFNADNAKIDAAIQAEASARIALEGQVAQKASSSALSSEASTRASAISSLNSQVAKKGNCQIYFSSYVGDGKSSRTLTFPKKPIMVFVMGDNIILRAIQGAPYAMCKTSGEAGAACSATWSGSSLTWSNSAANVTYICNQSGTTHYVVALIDAST